MVEVDLSQAGVLYTTPDSITQAVWEDGPISDQGWSVGQGPHHHHEMARKLIGIFSNFFALENFC
jgi:hypothetical protein